MVRHFTKSGKQLKTVEGIVIEPEDFPEIYRIADEIRKKILLEKEKTDKKQDS